MRVGLLAPRPQTDTAGLRGLASCGCHKTLILGDFGVTPRFNGAQ